MVVQKQLFMSSLLRWVDVVSNLFQSEVVAGLPELHYVSSGAIAPF
jgi:hypothetical protein